MTTIRGNSRHAQIGVKRQKCSAKKTVWIQVGWASQLKITFIGQEGETKKIVRLSKTGWYKFQPGDTYIRTEITFIKNYKYPTVGTGSTFYLNPVFRYDGTPPSNPLLAEINWPRTWILRLLGLGSVAGLFAAGWFVKRGKTT